MGMEISCILTSSMSIVVETLHYTFVKMLPLGAMEQKVHQSSLPCLLQVQVSQQLSQSKIIN